MRLRTLLVVGGLLALTTLLAMPPASAGCTEEFVNATSANAATYEAEERRAANAFVRGETWATVEFYWDASWATGTYTRSTSANVRAYPGDVETMGPFAATDKLFLAQSGATESYRDAAQGATKAFSAATESNATALANASGAATTTFAASEAAAAQKYAQCVGFVTVDA